MRTRLLVQAAALRAWEQRAPALRSAADQQAARLSAQQAGAVALQARHAQACAALEEARAELAAVRGRAAVVPTKDLTGNVVEQTGDSKVPFWMCHPQRSLTHAFSEDGLSSRQGYVLLQMRSRQYGLQGSMGWM